MEQGSWDSFNILDLALTSDGGGGVYIDPSVLALITIFAVPLPPAGGGGGVGSGGGSGQSGGADCTIQEWYRPVIAAGKDTGYNHVVIVTIASGVLTTYEGEPNPTPALPNSLCNPMNGPCPTNSLLTGVTTSNPSGVGGLGQLLFSLTGPTLCAKIGSFAETNTAYNRHQLHYVDNGQPNSNSYAFTLFFNAGLLFPGSPFGPPPNVPGWGYNVLTNPDGYQ